MAVSVDWSNSLLPSLNNGDLSYSMDSEKTNKLDAIKRTRIPYQKEVNPLVLRSSCKENFEPPITSREWWWRQSLRETPGPGKYDPGLYLTEQTIKRIGVTTSHFMGEGRAQDCQKYNKGAVLLPGSYELKDDLVSRLDKTINNYTFKDSGRSRDIAQIFYKDKNVNVPPNAYKIEEYLAVKVDNKSIRHPSFRSMTSRFPTGDFAPRVPGPGTYEKTFQFPQTQTIERMAKRFDINALVKDVMIQHNDNRRT